MDNVYREARFCRLCQSTELVKVLDLGTQYVTSFPLLPGTDNGVQVPLVVVFCPQCGLAQLQHTVHRHLLYEDYPYRSGVADTMRAALADVVKTAASLANVKARDLVIDIGSNDSFLLNQYAVEKLCLVGFEPARNIVATIGRTHKSLGDWTFIQGTGGPEQTIITTYFSQKTFRQYFPYKQATIITSVAMFYDVDDPLPFMRDVADLLTPDGIWINQMNDIVSVIDNTTLDFFSHEHLTHWSARPLELGLRRAGLQLFRVDRFPLNGGTTRFYICPDGSRPVEESVAALRERDARITGELYWSNFQERANDVKTSLNQLVERLTARGKKVFVYGASTRGNTLLQFCDLDSTLLPCALDRDPNKWGRMMVGTNIPIVSEEEGRRERPDFLLVLPYSYLQEFQMREKEFLDRGGKFIVPLPEPHIVGAED